MDAYSTANYKTGSFENLNDKQKIALIDEATDAQKIALVDKLTPAQKKAFWKEPLFSGIVGGKSAPEGGYMEDKEKIRLINKLNDDEKVKLVTQLTVEQRACFGHDAAGVVGENVRAARK